MADVLDAASVRTMLLGEGQLNDCGIDELFKDGDLRADAPAGGRFAAGLGKPRMHGVGGKVPRPLGGTSPGQQGGVSPTSSGAVGASPGLAGWSPSM